MMRHVMGTTTTSLAFVALVLTLDVSQALGQDGGGDTGPYFTSEFSTVSTFGNSEALTLGLSTTFGYRWEHSELKLEAGGIRTESTIKTRTAIGTPEDFSVQVERKTEKTAENYYARGRYDQNVNARLFVFGGADFLRNTFAGIDRRVLIAAGAGNKWIQTATTRLRTDVGITYTFQDDVVANPLIKMNFPGARLGYDLNQKLSETADFESSLVGDWNLDKTEDLRLTSINAMSVAISSKVALKPSLKLEWRNDPSNTAVSLYDNSGEDTGETVLVPLEKLDSFFTLSLVVRL